MQEQYSKFSKTYSTPMLKDLTLSPEDIIMKQENKKLKVVNFEENLQREKRKS